MKISDHPCKVVDEVITEVRAIKRGISERHGNDIDRLLASLIAQERTSGIQNAEQADAGQPAVRPEVEPAGGE
ncbi:MAG: hypothetical protein LR011_13930 [Verrucomicrobia bacterium]|nr:hypothetical protein [Verrucomicrobiota bacterium]